MRYLTKSSDAVTEAQTGGINDIVGARPRFADQALVNRAARALRPAASILRATADHAARRGGNEKPDLYAAAGCTKVRTYNALPNALPRYRTAAKDICYPLERFRFASGLRPRRRQFLSCG